MDKEKTHEERLQEWASLTRTEQIRRYYGVDKYPNQVKPISPEKRKAIIASLKEYQEKISQRGKQGE